MKVTYLKLVNFAVIYVGQGKDTIEINFPDTGNKIVAIQSVNGKGKSGLISNISPFAYPTSIDERSSLSVIRDNKNGYKEIHYKKDNNKYIIKHYYKTNKNGGHSVKSYFMLNDDELNTNGNVNSFLNLVEMHFGLTQDMMRLIRMGSNVSSFVSLTPAKRKEYIGSLINEIDMYMKIHKKINDDIRLVKVLLTSNHTNLYNCHITDIILEEEKLSKINKSIKDNEKLRDDVIGKLNKIDSMEKENDIEKLKLKRKEAEITLLDIKKSEEEIKSLHLESTTVDKLILKRSELNDEKINIQSKINSYRMTIDTSLKRIENIELNIKKITTNDDLESLFNIIDSLKNSISKTSDIVKNFNNTDITSNDIFTIISKLSSFNQISKMLISFGNKSIDMYLKLKKENKSIDKFLKNQFQLNQSRINDYDIKRILSTIFQDDDIITPNCDNQFMECPYYRLSESINTIKDKIEDELLDDETLRYIKIISNNIDNILNEIDIIKTMNIPEKLKEQLNEKSILKRLNNKMIFFDIYEFQEYLTIVKEYEIYIENVKKLKQYEYQISIYKKSGIDNQLKEIKDIQSNIEFYKNNINTLNEQIISLEESLKNIDYNIGVVTKYSNSIKYKSIVESTIAETDKILIPLESITKEKNELKFRLNLLNTAINTSREEAKQLENRINEYNKLVNEEKELSKKYNHLNIILESVSTKKGIPVLYMKNYLDRIQKLANKLLSIIYGDELKLLKFKVTQETFEIPYIKNGVKIPDIKYASQSEVPLTTMALSFALSNKASNTYNILLLDEMDAGFDEHNRTAFLKMLSEQMRELKAEQVFIISHNINNIIDIPIDVIKLSDIDTSSKLQNVIYE